MWRTQLSNGDADTVVSFIKERYVPSVFLADVHDFKKIPPLAILLFANRDSPSFSLCFFSWQLLMGSTATMNHADLFFSADTGTLKICGLVVTFTPPRWFFVTFVFGRMLLGTAARCHVLCHGLQSASFLTCGRRSLYVGLLWHWLRSMRTLGVISWSLVVWSSWCPARCHLLFFWFLFLVLDGYWYI